MTREEEVIDALDSLSYARTALDDPGALDGEWREPSTPATQAPNRYAIDKIDDAMRLLSPEKFSLMVAHNGSFVSRHFDPEEEAIDVIGEAIERKRIFPDDVITIVVGRVNP